MEHVYWRSIVAVTWLVWFAAWNIAARLTNKTRSTEGHLRRLEYSILLGLGFSLMFHGGRWSLIYGMLLPSIGWKLAGLALVCAGMLFMVWARVHLGRYWSGYVTLKEGHQLIRTGPYRLVRHPIYTGFLAAALGTALVVGTGDALAGC